MAPRRHGLDAKGRYAVMRAYMPTKGDLGLDMMTRTSTVQVNLDFENESDMVRKFRISLALQPIATALFAIRLSAKARTAASSACARRCQERHRSGPLRRAALRVRRGLRFRALRRLSARRPDVFVYRTAIY